VGALKSASKTRRKELNKQAADTGLAADGLEGRGSSDKVARKMSKREFSRAHLARRNSKAGILSAPVGSAIKRRSSLGGAMESSSLSAESLLARDAKPGRRFSLPENVIVRSESDSNLQGSYKSRSSQISSSSVGSQGGSKRSERSQTTTRRSQNSLSRRNNNNNNNSKRSTSLSGRAGGSLLHSSKS
jgi:hypothetical protein